MQKEIRYDRASRDYAAYLGGELVGYFGSYHEAEVELDRLASQYTAEAYQARLSRTMAELAA